MSFLLPIPLIQLKDSVDNSLNRFADHGPPVSEIFLMTWLLFSNDKSKKSRHF